MISLSAASVSLSKIEPFSEVLLPIFCMMPTSLRRQLRLKVDENANKPKYERENAPSAMSERRKSTLWSSALEMSPSLRLSAANQEVPDAALVEIEWRAVMTRYGGMEDEHATEAAALLAQAGLPLPSSDAEHYLDHDFLKLLGVAVPASRARILLGVARMPATPPDASAELGFAEHSMRLDFGRNAASSYREDSHHVRYNERTSMKGTVRWIDMCGKDVPHNDETDSGAPLRPTRFEERMRTIKALFTGDEVRKRRPPIVEQHQAPPCSPMAADDNAEELRAAEDALASSTAERCRLEEAHASAVASSAAAAAKATDDHAKEVRRVEDAHAHVGASTEATDALDATATTENHAEDLRCVEAAHASAVAAAAVAATKATDDFEEDLRRINDAIASRAEELRGLEKAQASRVLEVTTDAPGVVAEPSTDFDAGTNISGFSAIPTGMWGCLDSTMPLPHMVIDPENRNKVSFVLRVCTLGSSKTDASIGSLTNRWLVFVDKEKNLVATVHRVDSIALAAVRDKLDAQYETLSFKTVLSTILFSFLQEFEFALDSSNALLDECECNMLDYTKSAELRDTFFHLERKASVYERMIDLNQSLIHEVSQHFGLTKDIDFLEVKWNRLREKSVSLQDRSTNMLQLLLSLCGHRTTELMAILTRVSMVFLPMMFFTGRWGMNFVNMPELQLVNGYFFALGLMFVVAALTYLWMKFSGNF
jgi:magnesium transporter